MRIPLLALAALLTGCSAAYYGAMEKVGVHKRDILVDRVEDAQVSQEEAAEQFQSALEHFQSVVGYDGGELEDVYKDLADALERSEKRAEQVREHIDDVEDVGSALFREWEKELDDYSDDRLRRESEAQLRDTRRRYERVLSAMRRAEEKLEPVLVTFRDQVLFLKHNLNARAIGSLRGELATIENDVASLVSEMNRSIAEAREFIASMSQ